MYRRVAQKWVVFAIDETTGIEESGLTLTTLTANLRIDGGAANAVDDTNPVELEDGYYIFDITAAESDGDMITIAPACSVADIQVVGSPATQHTFAHVISGSITDSTPTVTNFETGTSLTGQGYSNNDQLNNRAIVFDGNTTAALKGKTASIADYISTNGEIVVDAGALVAAPATGDTFKIY